MGTPLVDFNLRIAAANSPRNAPSLSANIDGLINIINGPLVFNVLNAGYAGGADATGILDSTAAITAAINAAISVGGGLIYFPVGRYKCSPITLNSGANLTFMGAGIGASIIQGTGVGAAIFQINGIQPANWLFRDLTFDGVDRLTGTVSNAIYALRSTFITFDHVEAKNFVDDGFKIRNCANVFFYFPVISTCFNNGIEFSFNPTDFYVGSATIPTLENFHVCNPQIDDINDNNARVEGQGVYFAMSGGVVGNLPRGCVVLGGRIKNCVRPVHYECNIANLFFEQPLVANVYIEGGLNIGVGMVQARRGIVAYNDIRNCGDAASSAAGVDAIVCTQNGGYVIIMGNNIIDDRSSGTSFTRYGIRCTNVSNMELLGNLISCWNSINQRGCSGTSVIGLNTLCAVATPANGVGIDNDPSNTAQKGLDTNSYQGFAAANRMTLRPSTPVVFDRLHGSAVWNPPDLASGAQQTTTVTVTGAALGDSVPGVGFTQDLAGTTLTGYVSAADTVTVVQKNGTAGSVNLASGTLIVSVWSH